MPHARKAGAARPRCHRCNRRIHVPPGWSSGAAVRRHYWRSHRDIMLGEPRRTRT